MSQEIIYTSAPQGLRPGSFGFCTVATTPGMATSVAERLEALSGYRHVYPPGHPRAPFNPVAFSHVILKVGGQRLHVLSRIADAGLDYSQRSNKLAHHVALEPSELVPAGPAWVLAQPGFSETAWTGSPRILVAGRKPPTGELTGGICHGWQRLAGDAGWAGVLAQNGLEGKRPAYLIVPEGVDALALLVEAQAIVPPARRWEVSFSTFYTRLPPGTDCQWRCVLAGTPEAQSVAALRGELVIDLTRPLGRAPDGPLATTARTGLDVPQSIPSTATPPQPSRSDLLVLDESTPPTPVRPAPRRGATSDDELRLAPPPPPSSARRRQLVSPPAEPSLVTRSEDRRLVRGSRWLIATLVTSLVLSLTANAVLVVLIQHPDIIHGWPRMDLAFLKSSNPSLEAPAPEATPGAAPVPAPAPAADPVADPAKAPAPEATPGAAPVPAPAPAALPSLQENYVEAPIISQSDEASRGTRPKSPIILLRLQDANSIHNLSLIGGEFAGYKVICERDSKDKLIAWNVRLVQGEGDLSSTPVGQIAQLENKLTFTWSDESANSRETDLFSWCMLKIIFAGGRTHLLHLRQPLRCDPLLLKDNFLIMRALRLPFGARSDSQSALHLAARLPSKKVVAAFGQLDGVVDDADREVTLGQRIRITLPTASFLDLELGSKLDSNQITVNGNYRIEGQSLSGISARELADTLQKFNICLIKKRTAEGNMRKLADKIGQLMKRIESPTPTDNVIVLRMQIRIHEADNTVQANAIKDATHDMEVLAGQTKEYIKPHLTNEGDFKLLLATFLKEKSQSAGISMEIGRRVPDGESQHWIPIIQCGDGPFDN